MPDALNNRGGPQAREPSKCLNRWSYRERLAKKRPSDCQLQEAQKKDSDRAINPVAEAVHVRAHLVPPGYHLHAQLSLGKSCHRQKSVLHLCAQGHFVHRVTLSDSLPPCRLWPARLLSQGGGLSRQEYWNLSANTGCHTLLEHYISCCPNCQLP